jgi:predicted transcriptional regulator
MEINKLVNLINGRIVSDVPDETPQIDQAFSSDLMSDVLTLGEHSPMLITGLANLQTIRTAEMADILVVVLARGKRASAEMIALANDNSIVLIETSYSVFKTSGILYNNGIQPVF